jgi:hypothetical protein
VVEALLDGAAALAWARPLDTTASVNLATPAGGADRAANGAGRKNDRGAGLRVRLWDPSAQLRFSAKRKVPPRPDGAANRAPEHPRVGAKPPPVQTPTPVVAGWGD